MNVDNEGNIQIFIKGNIKNYTPRVVIREDCIVYVWGGRGNNLRVFRLNPDYFKIEPARYKGFTADAKGKFNSDGEIRVKISCARGQGIVRIVDTMCDLLLRKSEE